MAKAIAQVLKAHKYPDFLSVDAKDFPSAKNYKLGHKCELVVKVELVGLNKEEFDGEGDRVRFKVLSIKEHSHGKDN